MLPNKFLVNSRGDIRCIVNIDSHTGMVGIQVLRSYSPACVGSYLNTQHRVSRLLHLSHWRADYGSRGTMIQVLLHRCGRKSIVLCNWSPAYTVKYRQSTLHATLSLTLTPCKSMHGGLGVSGGLAFLSHRNSVSVYMVKLSWNSFSLLQMYKEHHGWRQ